MSSRQTYVLCFLVLILFVATAGFAYENNAILSWGDYVVTMGDGTDPALDNPQGIENMIKRWKGRGFTGVYWRADQLESDPALITKYEEGVKSGTLWLMETAENVIERFPVIQTAQQMADKHGLNLYAWYPTVYSRGAPVSGPGIWFPWPIQDTYMIEHPEAILVNRQGNELRYMLCEYAYPEARTSKIAEYVYFAQQYGIKKFLACMRTEDYQNQDPPDHADEFGFNQIIVDEMLSMYGVNILTDARFDCFSPTFNLHDSMVQNWRNLRGHYLTQFYRELRQALHQVDPAIEIAVQIPGGDQVGPTLGNWTLEWRKWIDEGLVDEIVIPINLSDNQDANSGVKGYLTDNSPSTGLYPASTFKNYIDNSPHPDIRLIYGGGPYFNFTNPPAYTDGWRTDITYDSYFLAWYQRWLHWKRDIRELGYIHFFKTDFDDFPLNDDGLGGGWGHPHYKPDQQRCPGYWYTIGDGSDAKPCVQTAIRRGGTGAAMKLTRSSDGSAYLTGRHYSSIDRSGAAYLVDNAISNGHCIFEFWMYRHNQDSSITAFLTYDGTGVDYNVGIYIQPGAYGPIYYWSVDKYYRCTPTMPAGEWIKFTLEVDVDNSRYSGYMGPNKETLLFSNAPYTKSVNAFNQLFFAPSSPTGNVTYIDDISVMWYPNMKYTKKSNMTWLKDDLSTYISDSSIHLERPAVGDTWQVSPAGSAGNFFIENDLSFGNGYRCLALRKNSSAVLTCGKNQPLEIYPQEVITYDFDVSVPQGSSFMASIRRSDTHAVVAGVYASTGRKWYYYNGTAYADSGISLASDPYMLLWEHIQIAFDNTHRTWSLVRQVVGEMPQEVIIVPWPAGLNTGQSLYLEIAPQGSEGTVHYIDNLEVTHGRLNVCGDEDHPYPVGDLNRDCIVNFLDVALFADMWMKQHQ